jgi:hypothetical protein
MSFGDDMTRAHFAAEAALDGEFLLVGFQTHGDAFRVWTATGEHLTVRKVEAAAHSILTAIAETEADRTDDCRACPDCQTRLARVRAALAALGDSRVPSPAGREAVH